MAAPVSDNLWIGDLPEEFSDEQVKHVFEGYGTIVSCRWNPPKNPGFKSSALVRFQNVQDAQWVVENLNGNMPEGFFEPIIVQFAKSPGGGKGGKADSWGKGGGDAYGKGGGKAGGAPVVPGDNIWVGDLPPEFTEAHAQQVFEGYGQIVSCKVIPPKSPGLKAAALIRFASVQDAQWVVENLNGNMPEGFAEPVIVQFARGGGKGKGSETASGGGGWGAGPGSYGKAPAGKGPAHQAQPYYDNYDSGKGGGKSGGGGFKAMYRGLVKGGYIPGSDGARPDEQCVYIKGLPTDTSDVNLFELFSPFGRLAPQGVKAMLHPDGTCTSVGFADFQDAASAQAAVAALNGAALPDGGVLSANLKRSKKGGPGKGAW